MRPVKQKKFSNPHNIMCEIAIIDPMDQSTEEIVSAAIRLGKTQGDGVGIVSVEETDDRAKFKYNIFKTLEPEHDGVESFIEAHYSETLRFIVHGRMATHGSVTVNNVHPLSIDCPECDIDYVLHNGVYAEARTVRSIHEDAGHSYQSDVDSEAIAHKFSTVPTTLNEDIAEMKRAQPAVIMLNEDAMYIRNCASYYELTEDARMAKYGRQFGPETNEETNYVEVIITPNNAE